MQSPDTNPQDTDQPRLEQPQMRSRVKIADNTRFSIGFDSVVTYQNLKKHAGKLFSATGNLIEVWGLQQGVDEQPMERGRLQALKPGLEENTKCFRPV